VQVDSHRVASPLELRAFPVDTRRRGERRRWMLVSRACLTCGARGHRPGREAAGPDLSVDVFKDSGVQRVIERFGAAKKVGVFVGAGASIEAGLPTWEELVQRLLDRAAREADLFAKQPRMREAWVDSMLRVESLLGAASVAQRELGRKLPRILQEELYREAGQPGNSGGRHRPSHYYPGPIAEQVAHLRAVFDDDPADRMHIYTTNYDDLLETALRDEDKLARHYDIYAYTRPGNEPARPLGVRHLHGYVGRDGRLGPFTLAEESYLDRHPADFWQEPEVVTELNQACCLFLASSLTDPNIVHYLYEHHTRPSDDERNAIVFVRQADPYDVPRFVRDAREKYIRERWSSRNLDLIFLDHYSDVAQLLYEIASRHKAASPKQYTSLARRSEQYLGKLRSSVLDTTDRDVFQRRQKDLNEALSDIVSVTTTALAKRRGSQKVDLSTELGLTLGLWLLSPNGRQLTLWGATDRIWCDDSTLQSLALNPRDDWVPVKAFCDGKYTAVEWSRDNSRWKYILGIPLWTEKTSPYGRLPIGVLTLATQTPANVSKLANLDYSQRLLLGRTLALNALKRLDALSS
jgi:hypothetical protein